ncbi:MAG: glycosyltransferase family 1 protein [Gemmatimonadota bacterium]
MRIVFFTESLLPLVDGVSHTLNHLFTSLEADGVDFRVYAPFLPGPEISWSPRVHRVRSFTFPLYRDYRISLPGSRRLAAELDDYAPDLVHVVSPTPMAVWAQSYARSRGIPVVATFHTHFVSYFPYYYAHGLQSLGWLLLRRFHGRCAATFAPSSSICEELRAHGIRNVHLWSRGVDACRFSPQWRDDELRALVGANDRTPMVLLVSRLVKEKDMKDLVGMDRVLRERGVAYRLAIVGDGPLRARMQKQLPHAYFAGHQSGPALSRWYASGDVFVFPSTTETFANVVQEAMASGLPAVVVDRGGPPGVIEPGRSGLVAKAWDPASLAACVERLVGNRELRLQMGMAARARAQERTWDAVNAVLLSHYGRIAGRAPERQRRLA